MGPIDAEHRRVVELDERDRRRFSLEDGVLRDPTMRVIIPSQPRRSFSVPHYSAPAIIDLAEHLTADRELPLEVIREVFGDVPAVNVALMRAVEHGLFSVSKCQLTGQQTIVPGEYFASAMVAGFSPSPKPMLPDRRYD